MKHILFWGINGVIIGGTILLMVLAAFGFVPLGTLTEVVSSSDNLWLVGSALMALMFVATVVAPITTFFMVPLAAGVIGPVPAALFSATGWFFGSIVAFMLARHFGKPLLVQFIDEEKIALYEKYIPAHMGFVTLVFLRMVISPDILSYAMGFMSSMRLVPFAIATAIGLLPFALLSAYAGSALLSGNYLLLAALVAFGVLLWCGIWYMIVQNRNRVAVKSVSTEQ